MDHEQYMILQQHKVLVAELHKVFFSALFWSYHQDEDESIDGNVGEISSEIKSRMHVVLFFLALFLVH